MSRASSSTPARLDAPLLNSRISNAPSADALLELFAQHGAQMDAMHHGNLWNKLGRHVRQQHASRKLPPARAEPLLAATLAHAPNCGAQPIANIAGGVAHVGVPSSAATPLFEALAARAKAISAKLEPRHAANLAWAYASVGVSSSPMVDAISMVIRRRAAEFNAQELVMATAALGRLHGAKRWKQRRRRRIERALKRLARAARPWLGELRLLDLDELCGAYARLGLAGWGARLTAAAAAAGAAALRGGGNGAAPPVRCVANLLWAVARLASSNQLAKGRVATQRDVVALAVAAQRVVAARSSEFNARDCANAAWGFVNLGHIDDAAMLAIARRAAAILPTFNAQEVSKLLYATGKADVKCAELDAAAAAERVQSYEFGGAAGSVALTHILGGGRALAGGAREKTGATGATGGALWEASFVLADWLSRPAYAVASLPAAARALLLHTAGASVGAGRWAGVDAVELGAGLGLPSIVGARLGMRVVATDGDAHVLQLLEQNAARNAKEGGAVRVATLEWGTPARPQIGPHPGDLVLAAPDLILASGCVYGVADDVWAALVRTLAELAGPATVILLAHGNGAAPGVQQMRGRFYELLARERFAVARVEPQALHADHRRGVELHCVTRR